MASTRDARSAEALVESAVACVGGQEATAPVLEALRENGVLWAWQLEQADPNDWIKFGASTGLKLAIKAELQSPTAHSMPAVTSLGNEALGNEQLRRFLLVPTPNGEEPERLRTVGGLFLALLTIPPSNQQSLMLALFEMLALVGGLLLPLPLQLFRSTGQGSAAALQGWTLMPSREDWTDAVAVFILVMLIWIVFCSVTLALCVASSGWHASTQYCEAVIPAITTLLMAVVFGVIYPYCFLLFWQLFTVAESPYPLIGAAVLAWTLHAVFIRFNWNFHIEGMALELWHLPSWMMAFIRFVLSTVLLGHLASRLTDKALEPAAKKRAAELRGLVGM